MPPHHCITTSLHHRITALVSHLPCPLPPNQSVICLAPCHQTSHSFALPPATKAVSHLTCPLPPCHRITMPPHYCATASPRHRKIFPTTWIWIRLVNTTQHSSDWLIVPTTANQITGIRSPHHCTTTSLHHCKIFPTTWVWIWLVNTTQHSSDWLIVPTTANQITGIRSPHHCTTTSPHHHMRFSPPHGYESDWLILPNTVLIGLLSPPQPIRSLGSDHRITASPYEICPTTWVWIWLVNTTQQSSDWLIVPTTANQITGIRSPHHRVTTWDFPHHMGMNLID